MILFCFICCNHLLLVIPFEIFNANLCFALAFCFVLSCLAFMFFVVLQSLISSFVLCFFFLPHACRCLHLALIAKKKKKTKTKKQKQKNPNCGAHKSASLNVLVAVDDLLSAPVPLLGLLWLVASLLGLGCVVWTEQFTPVWPSCRQVSFLWEVFQWNPRGERFFGGWPFPASNVSNCIILESAVLVCCQVLMLKLFQVVLSYTARVVAVSQFAI